MDGGLLILSRYPIISTASLRYNESAGADGICAKGVLYAQVQLTSGSEGTMHVFTTHTQSGEFHPETTIRENQITAMASFISTQIRRHSTAPVLIGGDFNLDARHDYLFTDHDTRPTATLAVESKSYLKMTNLFKKACGEEYSHFRNVIHDVHKKHLVTNGIGHSLLNYPPNSVHTDIAKCIDYFFLAQTEPKNIRALTVTEASVDECRLPQNLKSGKRVPITHISDHFGLQVTISFNRPTEGDLTALQVLHPPLHPTNIFNLKVTLFMLGGACVAAWCSILLYGLI